MIKRCFGSVAFVLLTALYLAAQAPIVEKIDPPSWWAESTVNPVRVLIRGTNLGGARVESGTVGITASNFKSSSNGHYLFADIAIAENVKPGEYKLQVTNRTGSTNVTFTIFTPLQRYGNFSGFSTDDVIYFLMPDRFADGDPTNNDPPKSR